ncbi:MAG: hypothetical protein AAF648_14770 [Pseudomonadota bacterium]
MACEAEQTNVEFLELLEEMAQNDVDAAYAAVNRAMHELSDSCGGELGFIDFTADPDDYNVTVNVPTLAEFLERLRNGELSAECEQLFDDVVERNDEAQRRVHQRDQFRKAHEEARKRLRDCMHRARTGAGGT